MTLFSRVLRSSWLLLGISAAQRMLGLASTLVLARLLTPEDFGVIAIAALVVHFADVLSNAGSMQYVVCADVVDEETVATAWTLNLLLKAALTVLIWVLLPVLAMVWPPETLLPIAVLAPMIALRALQSPRLLIDRREMNYRRIFRVQVGQKIVAFACAVGFALYLRSYWAVVIADLVSNVVAVLLSYMYAPVRPRATLSKVREQWSFSRWMLIRAGIGYMRAQIDTTIAAAVVPLAALGRYNMARELTVMPSMLVLMPMLEPLLASFSRSRETPEMLHRQLALTLFVLTSATLPAALFLAVHAEAVVVTLLGEQWRSAAPLVVALAPTLLVFPIGSVVNNLLMALGRMRMLVIYDLVSLVLLTLVLSLAVGHGLAAFAGWRAAVGVVTSMAVLGIVSAIMRFDMLGALRSLVLPVLAAVVALMLVKVAGLPDTKYAVLGTGLVFLASYAALLLALSRAPLLASSASADLERLMRPALSGAWERLAGVRAP